MALNWGDFLWTIKRYQRLNPVCTEVEVDFGSVPVWDAEFTVSNSEVIPTTNIAVVSSGRAAEGRAAGDDAWDSITASASPSTGSFTIYAKATPGPVVGKRNLLYIF